jgi:hypothetical protein
MHIAGDAARPAPCLVAIIERARGGQGTGVVESLRPSQGDAALGKGPASVAVSCCRSRSRISSDRSRVPVPGFVRDFLVVVVTVGGVVDTHGYEVGALCA